MKKSTGSFDTLVTALHLPNILWGLYLFNIFFTDIQYGNSFIWYEEEWKRSFFCCWNNFLVLTFHLLSPLSIGLLTLARLMVVLYPLDSKFKKKYFTLNLTIGMNILVGINAALTTAVMWVTKVPLPSRLCNLIIDPSRSLATVYAWIIALYQSITLGSIIIMYIKLVLSLTKSKEKVKTVTKRNRSNKPIIRPIIILTVSCSLCWVPVNLMSISTQFMDRYPIEMVAWIMVLFGSINSMVYPLLFFKLHLR